MNMTAKKTEINDIAVDTAVESGEKDIKSWIVSVNNSPAYCGIGAGGVQFANGKAEITSKRMADWFMEHDGYTVIPKK